MNLLNLLQAPGKVTVGAQGRARGICAIHRLTCGAGGLRGLLRGDGESNDWGLVMLADHPRRVLQFHPHPG